MSSLLYLWMHHVPRDATTPPLPPLPPALLLPPRRTPFVRPSARPMALHKRGFIDKKKKKYRINPSTHLPVPYNLESYFFIICTPRNQLPVYLVHRR